MLGSLTYLCVTICCKIKNYCYGCDHSNLYGHRQISRYPAAPIRSWICSMTNILRNTLWKRPFFVVYIYICDVSYFCGAYGPYSVFVFRLHGSYEALKYGTLLDGLADLTGGITESINIRQDQTTCGRMIGKMLDMTSIVTCTVQPASPQVWFYTTCWLQRLTAVTDVLGIVFKVTDLREINDSLCYCSSRKTIFFPPRKLRFFPRPFVV